MYTRHGHQIPGTPIATPEPNEVARCGGPGPCKSCAQDAYMATSGLPLTNKMLEDGIYVSTDDTQFKVFHILRRNGMDDKQARYTMTEMANSGILFREREQT